MSFIQKHSGWMGRGGGGGMEGIGEGVINSFSTPSCLLCMVMHLNGLFAKHYGI